MKKALIFLLMMSGPCFSSVQAQNIEGQIIASEYGQWKIAGYAPDTYVFSPTACRVQGGNSFFAAFTVGTPVLIVDGDPALDEVVTPSSVVENNVTCSISINPIYHHNLPFYITSATGGLQEAINANVATPSANTIVLNSAWHQLTRGDAAISSVVGSVQLGLIDVTTLPSNWYRWNGAQYVLVPVISSISSVFGRTGDVTAETGDYTCAQVTGCPLAVVNSFNNRSAAVTPQSGDYTCDQVTGCPTGTIVNSFNSRTGAVVPTSGDYTCSMVTGCATGGPVTGWDGALTANQASTDTTASVALIVGTIPTDGGYFRLDSEWEHFTSATFISGLDYTLNGVTRAQFNTSAAAHTSGASLIAAILPFGNSTQSMFAFAGGSPGGNFVAVNCPTATSQNGTVIFEVGCGITSSFYVNPDGHFDVQSSTPSYIWGSGGLSIDTNTTLNPNADLLNNAYALKATARVIQTTLATQMDKGIGFGAGITGVNSIIAVAAVAPTLQDVFVPTGSTTNTYLCQGTDYLGNNIPGTSASLTNLAASGWGTGALMIYCPLIPGAVTTTLYRTAGGPNQGIIASANSGQLTFEDQYTSASAGSPNASNTTLGAVCTNGNQFCLLSGTTSTPPVSCGSAQEGWEFHDVEPSPTHHAYICESGTWTGVY